jgi:predicted DsbA family dithiol-disulfide isomerase
MPFIVEIWSDVVCPWCYIGKRRFEAALARFPQRDDVEVRYRSFELDPTAERSNDNGSAEALAAKYGMSVEQMRAMRDQITSLAAEEGLEYHLDDTHGGNTLPAHRLIHLAEAHGLQHEAKERLMHAYFSEGAAIGDDETLVRLIAEVGVDADEARAVLASDRYEAEVREDEDLARRMGINGVPFYVLGRRYGVSGAQPPEALLEALGKAYAEAAPAQ